MESRLETLGTSPDGSLELGGEPQEPKIARLYVPYVMIGTCMCACFMYEVHTVSLWLDVAGEFLSGSYFGTLSRTDELPT